MGGWVEEEQAVRMRCWAWGLGGWVGGEIGRLNELSARQGERRRRRRKKRLIQSIIHRSMWVDMWVGGWVGFTLVKFSSAMTILLLPIFSSKSSS